MQMHYPSRAKPSRRFVMVTSLVLAVWLLVACGSTSGKEDDVSTGTTPVDKELLDELARGWLAPSEMYEVQDFVCTKLSDRIHVSATIVNLNDYEWAFGINWTVEKASGERLSKRLDPGMWEPGKAAEISTWFGKPDDFADSPPCELEVRHSTILAMRRLEDRPMTYERLGWDADAKRPIDPAPGVDDD